MTLDPTQSGIFETSHGAERRLGGELHARTLVFTVVPDAGCTVALRVQEDNQETRTR